MLSTENPPKHIDTHGSKVDGWRNRCHANTKQKKAGVAMLISDRGDFKARKVIRDKKGHYMMIKGVSSLGDMQFLCV